MFCVANSWEGVCVGLYLLPVCVFFLPRVAAPGEDARHKTRGLHLALPCQMIRFRILRFSVVKNPYDLSSQIRFRILLKKTHPKTVEDHEKQNILTFRNYWPYGSHWPTSWLQKAEKGTNKFKESNNENFNNTLTKTSMVLHSALRCTCAQISPLGLKNVPTSAQLLTNQKTWSFLYPILNDITIIKQLFTAINSKWSAIVEDNSNAYDPVWKVVITKVRLFSTAHRSSFCRPRKDRKPSHI